MGQVLGIVYRAIATQLIKKAGHSCKTAQTGAVTLIQRFGSALNLNIHFHMLFLDGVYIDGADGRVRFRWVKAPSSQELTQLAHTIAHRVGRLLERQGLLERDAENSYLAGDAVDDDPLSQLLGSSITYRIAVGPQAGRKVFTLQTLPACDPDDPLDEPVGKVAGFSLHAGVAGVFAPNSQRRALVTPAKRGKGNNTKVTTYPQTPAERHASMSWAQRLKRVFNIDIETCRVCGGAVKVIACIEDPVVIKQILAHLQHKAQAGEPRALPESRAPPAGLAQGLFD